MNAHSSTIHNSPKMETTQISTDDKINNMIYPYNRCYSAIETLC